MNLLILSCGTRNKIVQYFRQALSGKGKVFATDCSSLAPALYEADEFFIVPRIDDDGYLEHILKICKDYAIDGVLSLIDPELSLLSKHKDLFLKIGAIPIVPDYEVVEMCFDKYEMYKFLKKNNLPTVRSYIDTSEFFEDINRGLISYPVFVKPVRGSASININKVDNDNDIKSLFDHHDNLMIQEYMNGKEYGADAYIDIITNETVQLFIKEKIIMRAGETDKSVSYKDNILLEVLLNFIKLGKFKGVIDIDIFKVDDKYYISEVNPRFGGGYPHAHECGVNIAQSIISNLLNIKNGNFIDQYETGIYMMKYNELKII